MSGPACFSGLASQICSFASQICSFASQTCNLHLANPLFMKESENIIEFLIKSLKETLLKGFEQKNSKEFFALAFSEKRKELMPIEGIRETL